MSILDRQLNGELPIPGKTNLDWYLFYKIISDYREKPMLEVGVGRGGTALTMAYMTPLLDVIDSWDQTWKKEDVEKILPANFIDCKSSQAEIDKDYACIHLDANKSYGGTLCDLIKYSSYCNGVICVDDYLQSMWPEVTRAVDEFVSKSSWKRILIGNHQVFLSHSRTPAVKQIAREFPVAMVDEEIFLSYGKLPTDKLFQKFMSVNNNMLYTWHNKAYT
tara:strand:+ start:877 stop:1536 length:660 start_codon:yes stop_codon:yes gene_type:complete